MTKCKSRSMFMALALSLIMVIGLLPVTAMAADEQEIQFIEIWADNRTTPHPWAPSHIFIEGDPIYVVVQANYADGSTGFLSADEVDFTIVSDFVTVLATDTGVAEGQILIQPQQPLLSYFFYIEASLKADPEIRSACNIQIDEIVVRSFVVGQEYGNPIVEKGQSVQLSYEVYPESLESRLIWSDWQKDFPEGKIGTDSYITKDGLLYVGWNETEPYFCAFPPISNGLQTVRYNASAPSIKIEAGTAPHVHTEDGGSITKSATCASAGEMTFSCTGCGEALRTEPIAKLAHSWDDGVITIPATQENEGQKTFTCTLCGGIRTEIIPKLPVTPVKNDAEFLREKASEILRNGLSRDNLRLNGKTLTLVLDGREFVLSTNAKNRNISGEIALGDGYFLKFDIKGNGSNVKEFKVIQK